MSLRRALLLAALAVAVLPGAASAAEVGPVSTGAGLDEQWVCLGEPGKPAYCITLWVPGD